MGIEDREIAEQPQRRRHNVPTRPADPRPVTETAAGLSWNAATGSTIYASNLDYYYGVSYTQAMSEGRADDWMSGFRSSENYKGPQASRFDTGTWSSDDTSAWYGFTSAIREYGFTNQSEYKERINKLASDHYKRTGVWPTAAEMLENPYANAYLVTLQKGYNQFGATFAIDGEAFYNDPYMGPQSLRGNVNDLGPGAIDRMLNEGTLDNSGQIVQPAENYTRQEFDTIIERNVRARGGGSGGGGGGGGGRTAVAWDRADLIEQASDRWRGLMLEDPAADIEKLVDDYINKANSFWMSEGGRLEFDTFIVNKARETGRYKQLYSRLPQHMTEEEYIAGFRQTAERYGMNQSATRRETVAGAQAGVGLAGFSDRVSRTREARNANTGGFSQQLAATFKSMPGLAGS